MLRAMTVNDVAAHFDVNRTTIYSFHRKLNQNGDVSDIQRPGRPRKTTAAEDRQIRILHPRYMFKSAAETSRNWSGNEPKGQ